MTVELVFRVSLESSMTEFVDLSPYDYFEEYYRPTTLNVGWISPLGEFQKAVPSEVFTAKLLAYTRVSVAQSRGCHYCAACPPDRQSVGFGLKGDFLAVGMAEIRVFSSTDIIYAAPTLLHHYVNEHHYCPPKEFVTAVMEMPTPPDPRYFALLSKHELEWMPTWSRRR